MIYSQSILAINYLPPVINTEYDTGLTVTINTIANEKVYINALLPTMHNNTPTPGMLGALYVLYIDATPVFTRLNRNASQNYNSSSADLAYVSNALTAGSHTIKITMRWMTGTHQPTLWGASTGSVILYVIQYRG